MVKTRFWIRFGVGIFGRLV